MKRWTRDKKEGKKEEEEERTVKTLGARAGKVGGSPARRRTLLRARNEFPQSGTDLDRFSSSRSTHPWGGPRETLCFKNLSFPRAVIPVESLTRTPPIPISGKNSLLSHLCELPRAELACAAAHVRLRRTRHRSPLEPNDALREPDKE